MTQILASRLSLFKFLGTVGVLHYGLTALSNTVSQNKIMSVTDYIRSESIKENTTLKVFGTVVPKSLKLNKQTLGKQFSLSDNINQIICRNVGYSKQQFSEGETLVVTGFCPDTRQKNILIINEIQTNHSMATKQWQKKQNVSNNNYGIEVYK